MKIRDLLSKILPESWVPYLLHLRPRAWPIVAAHMAVGFLLANGFDFEKGVLQRLLLAAFTWGVIGNGGTLAINSYYDQDKGDIGYLDNPPDPPKHLHIFSLILLGLGIPLAALLGWRFLTAYLICAVLSLIYSVPPLRVKARAGFDVLINSIGFGGLTIYAGWAAMNRPLNPTIINVVLGFVFLFAAFYPLTQIYQMEEDRQRGDKTLALLLNKPKVFHFAGAAVLIGFIFFVTEALTPAFSARSIGIVVSLSLWAVLLIHWLKNHATVDIVYEKRGFYRALWIWALTDISIVLAFAPFILPGV